jgi:hypothetical protein
MAKSSDAAPQRLQVPQVSAYRMLRLRARFRAEYLLRQILPAGRLRYIVPDITREREVCLK